MLTLTGKALHLDRTVLVEHRPLGDTTTLADPAVVDELRHRGAEEASTED